MGMYGATGIEVSRVGLGAGGLDGLEAPEAVRLIHHALDLGVTFIDTAPSYGRSEALIGEALFGQRRAHAVVSTKLGYGVPGEADWTGPCIAKGVDQALQRMRMDHIDIAHLHSCPAEVLEREGVVDALLGAKEAGKVRAVAYSGDGHALHTAWMMGVFDGFQATVSVLDRHNLPTLALAEYGGRVGKRVLANAPWRFQDAPSAPDLQENHRRWRAAALDLDDPGQVFLRWALHHAGLTSALVGTTRPQRLESALADAERGPLPGDVLALVDAAWAREGADWSPLT